MRKHSRRPDDRPHCRAAGSLPRRRASRGGDDDAVAGADAPSSAALPGDLIILGVGGKIGPTLARLAKRAAPGKRVVGVARFSEPGLREKLTACGIECIAADLLDREQIEALPKLANVVFMAGRKFGSSGHEDLTWAMNAHVPALVAEAFAGSRIVAYSTGCVYPYVERAARRRDRGDAGDAAARRLRQFLRRARGHVPVFLAHARHARPHHPAQLRDRHALRRAARRRDARAHRARRSISPPATSTSSGRATPTPWCCARSATARCRRARSMSAGRRP